MKRVSSLVIVIILCLSIFLLCSPKIKAETNSSSFETGFDGWQPFTIGHGTAQRSSSYSHSGSYSVEQIAETSSSDVASSYGGIRFPITVASDQYELNCWIFVTQRSDGLSGTYIGFYYPTDPFPYREDVTWNVWSDGSSYVDVRKSEGYTPNLGVPYGLTLNTWHQVRIVLQENLGTVSIWLDGMKIVDSYPAFNAGDKPDSYFITASATQGGYVNHQYVDDVVISDEKPPVGYWKFDEGSGTIAHDSSGNGNDGIVNGASWTGGIANGALQFDGISNYVGIQSSQSLTVSGNQISLELWIKPTVTLDTSLASRINIMDKGDEYGFQMEANDAKINFFVVFGSGMQPITTTTNSWKAGTWYQIVGTYDGANQNVYVNGVLESTKPLSGNLRAGGYCPLSIGSYTYGTMNFFNGAIDEVKIYNYARTAQEIWDDYSTHYYLTVKTDPLGIATVPGEGWYDASSTATLTAPSFGSGGYRFWGWDVDGTSQGTTNLINVPMSSAHTATAHYFNSAVGGEWAPIDTVQLVSPWIALVFLAIAFAAAASHRLLKKRL